MHAGCCVLVCAAAGLLAGGAVSAREPALPEVPLYELISAPSPIEGVMGVLSGQQIAPHNTVQLHALLDAAIRARGEQREALLAHQHYRLPLPGDTDAIVVLHTADKSVQNRLLASGRVISGQGGHLVLIATPTTLDVRLTVGGHHFQVRSIGSKHVLLKLDPAALPPEAPPFLPGPLGGEPPHAHPSVTCVHGSPKIIRVLVLYTDAARAGAAQADESILEQTDTSTPPVIDPDASIQNAVLLALQEANSALEYSHAKTRFDTELAAQWIDIGYAEPGSGDAVLAALYTASHPLHRFAAGRRGDSSANLVATIVEHWHFCGGAPVMIDWNMHPDQAAFSVVTRACLGIKEQSLGHELAHSMGSAHDREHAQVPGLFHYSYGFNEPRSRAGTMMAYPCPGCARAPQFSNPGVNFPAHGSDPPRPSGCPVDSVDPDCRPAFNARSIDRAACQVVTWQ